MTIIPVKADKIYIDDFDDLYILSGSSLMKFTSDGKQLFSFDSSYSEDISLIDIKNPMKILIFYKNQNKLLFLDNKLSLIGNEIYLENINIYGNVLTCSAENGGVWILDVSGHQLLKYDADFKIVLQKDLFEIKEIPDYIISGNNSLYIKTDKNFVYVFDNLGNFNFKIEKNITSEFKVQEPVLNYFNKNKKVLVSYNIKTGNSLLKHFPDTLNIQDAVKSSDYLIFNDEAKVYVSEIINEKTDKQ